MKSVMKHSFSHVPQANIQRSTFKRVHGHKTTFDSGKLVPIYVDEALPGDSFNMNATFFVRMMSALEVPVMDNMFLDVFYFAVPMRLVWENFTKFMGERPNPGVTGVYDPTDYIIPQVVSPSGGFAIGGVSDYFGLPTVDSQNGAMSGNTISVSSLWHRGYNLIYNEWFRDQNLIDSVTVDTDDGPDTLADYDTVLRRAKRHDYFTSALPWPQKGPGVSIELTGNAPVVGIGITKNDQTFGSNPTVIETGGAEVTYAEARAASSNLAFYVEGTNSGASTGIPSIYADLTDVSAATINSLRESFQLQKLYERDARGGSRYTEIVRSHFGVISPDARLQRPEYLGGGTSQIMVNPVQKNATVPDGSGGLSSIAGDLSAYATATSRNGFTKSFTEHSLIFGIICVRADLTYQQGIPRMFSRSTRWDFYWPALAHLGEQEILNKEIYAQGDSNDDDVFGYQERWAEYRYAQSKITGKLRSTYSTPLDVWHLSQEFTSLPTLSEAFIEENPPVQRIIAVTSEPEFVFDSYFKCITARPMPTYSVPGQIDRF